MMKSLFLLLVIAVSQINADCPLDWVLWGSHCYKFVYYPLETRNNASIECGSFGAALVSVDSPAENSFIKNKLGSTDMQRESWYTSGVFYENGYYKWMGDGMNFSYPSSLWFRNAEQTTQGQYVAYEFRNNTYGLVRSVADIKRCFICEIDVKENFRIYQMKRDFDYGKPLRDLNKIKRGPKIIQEPENAIVVGSPLISYMQCTAFGNPQPTYEWRKNNVVISSSQSSRYTLTNGRLTISKPIETEDAGYYACFAKNEFGTIRSENVLFSFGELGKFNNIKPEGIRAKLYEGTNLKCQPPSYKPAIQFQWYKNTPNNFIRTNLLNYIFISKNGRLYFSEVSNSDAGDYYCVISLVSDDSQVFSSAQMPSRTSLGLTLAIETGGVGNIAPNIQNEFPAVFPGQPLEGQTISIECFAYGTAQLNYKWSRKDKPMPYTATFVDFNRVLQIKNAQLADSGVYTCHVSSSSKGLDSKDFSLSIQAKPKFHSGLRDQLVDIGTQLTWRCDASGKPSPTYYWYKDSVLLKNRPGKYIVNNNVLIILNIQPSDNGMYQCQATNEFGKAFSTGQLKSFKLKPNFYKYPLPPRILASVNGNGTIACRPEAVPRPTITFYKNNQPLSVSSVSGHFISSPSGELTITNVQKSDEGIYKCEATNELGTASSTTNLTVITGTTITIPPMPTTVIYNETAVMKCLASYNAKLDIFYSWSFNGYKIDFRYNPFYIRGTGINRGDLYIRNAMYRHEGFYRCTVRTIVNGVWSEAFLTVKGPPGEPQGLKVSNFVPNNDPRISLDSRSVLLTWMSEVDHGSPVTYYSVEFKTTFNNQWTLASALMGFNSEIPVNKVFLFNNAVKATVIHNLSPASVYKFRIKAINRYGVGRNSFATDWIKMPPDVPTKSPDEVGGGGGKVRTLTITWKPMAEEDYNGDKFKYIVYWRKKSNSVLNDPKWNEKVVPASISQYVTLVGKDDYYSEYEVQVQAKNNIGYGPKSAIAVIYSAEDLPGTAVKNVQALPYNGTAIMVYWDEIPDKREIVRGKLLGYRIKYWLRNDNESRAIEAIIYGQTGQGLVIGLLSNTYYTFRVIVFNSAGFGPRSDTYFAKCYHLPPQDYPTEVDVIPYGVGSCKVTFRGISTYTNEEPIQGYRIKYWRATDNIREAKIDDIGRNSYGYVHNLERGVVYKLRVYGFSRGGDGKMSSPVTRFTITKDGMVRKDMYDPNLTSAMYAGASCYNPAFSLYLLTLIAGRILTLNWN